jgi:hypothetical protein
MIKNQKDKWISLYFKEIIPSDDDGFQSASSSLLEDKLALVPIAQSDHWSRALIQAENKYFTWEQRGR